ncbi:MAG: type II toxin-antitoxin system HipA family toxin [Eubacterium sp.]|nr:type II toxin-antitoxin system HipA family toxin [Butyrivibrio sp.]MBP3718666.1 type II toxin-antitoxin system HipA family toxin [Eubacterium sp.]MBR1772430.1 type II toxin-antitoxin system HipA family toxin [Eubacterium sp.]
MINTAEVILWGTRIGVVHQDDGKPYVSFEYDKDFIGSGIEVSPIKMRLSNVVYEFPDLSGDAFHGAPGLIADSLPDKFGNRVIERWLMEQGHSLDDFNTIDRLCYTGVRGMGALEYRPVSGPKSVAEENVNIDKMVEFASKVLSDKESKKLSVDEQIGYSQLVQLGTSAGGARAKALIAVNEETSEIKSGQIDAGNGFEYWLIKFDGVKRNGDHNLKDSVEYTLIEYAYYLMAKAAGIYMEKCKILEENGRHHFMTKRFDRVENQKIHMQTLGALTHIDYNYPGQCSYEQAAEVIRLLNSSMSDVEQLYRRMVFNVIFVNQDDHVKNISFLMNKMGEWRLSPAYDITFSYNLNNRWLKAHQMLVNGKSEKITYNDLISAGKNMGIASSKCKKIINDIIKVLDDIEKYFEQVGVREETYSKLAKVINLNTSNMLSNS